MWVAGIGQGLMLRAFDQYGNLAYTFVETVTFMHIPYVVRAVGGALFLSGMALMAYNLYMTVWGARREVVPVAGQAAVAATRV
jgi:cytochrome c oxidase cbb3-type subunit 1